MLSYTDYRLALSIGFPAAVEDVRHAIADWLTRDQQDRRDRRLGRRRSGAVLLSSLARSPHRRYCSVGAVAISPVTTSH